ncbi:hypothetical protein [Dermatobacter hominis]|uniref:hypothetical protein n=1 Tax=Dermatobacter hominis TaxID=2884263 RepID=UPI001D122E16|nr:hypothetical protein [Dermatobacter hominis]UDY37414.1 hypothetical protein LH044_07695 [Dermatobacter hominis]
MLVVAAFGALVGVDAPDGVLERLAPLLAPAAAGPGDAEVHEVVRVDPGSVASVSGGRFHAEDERQLVRLAASQVHLCVAVHARDAMFVHAGAVSWRGIGIVLPGRSMSGKSTLTRALVAAGAEYCSDEYAVLDDEGLLHPYPTPLSIRRADGSTVALDPQDVGIVATTPVPVGLVVATRHREGATWAPIVLEPATGAVELVDDTVVARLDPVRTIEVAAAVAGRARTIQGDRPEADVVAPLILGAVDELLAGDATVSPS